MKFTVIVPIYNVELYLDECIQSIIKQTLPFTQYIDLILVNDGSTDSSEIICLEYKKQYPNNIHYIKINNSGPSVARNTGLKLISNNTKYLTFLDADDKLELNALELVLDFFNSNQKEKIAILPVYYFEKKNGPIKLNNRFNLGMNTIDITKIYSAPHFYIGGVFFDKDLVLESDISFNQDLSFWEDALFVNKLIILEGKYSLVNGTKYWYRQRTSNDSIVNIAWHDKSRYTQLIKQGYKKIIDFSITSHGYILPYIQYLIIYHLKLLTFKKNNEILLKLLSKKELDEFISSVKKLLSLIDRKYILEQDTRNTHKELLLTLKEDKYELLGRSIIDVNPNSSIKITRRKITGLNLLIERYFSDDNYVMKKEDRIFVKSSWSKFFAKPMEIDKELRIWDIKLRDYKCAGFSIKIPLWLFTFQFGINTDSGGLDLKKFNVVEYLIIKIKGMLRL